MHTFFDYLTRRLVFAVVLLSVSSLSLADELKACFAEWSPYSYTVEGEPTGISVDIIKAAANRAGFKVLFDSLPWQRCLIMVQAGEYHFTMDTPERPELVHGKYPNAVHFRALWQRSNSDYGEYKSLNKLLDKRLALIKGFQYSKQILSAEFQVIEWVQSEAIAGRMIAGKRLDLVFADLLVMQKLIQDLQLPLKPMLPVYDTEALYPSFNPKYQMQMERLDEALEAMYADGSLDEIYRLHTGVSLSELTVTGLQVR
ncbi:substrate-binding periplasmic protein [Aliamphritea ceti]|uniref:substrate-binding periplasmic protein n=1 Tax=Aliamphritea ceti TaxID=1524258 RepID=UPI0021C2FA58|nr:transporter substrate-binding domain-containing protein [Aliamphritea ceti]